MPKILNYPQWGNIAKSGPTGWASFGAFQIYKSMASNHSILSPDAQNRSNSTLGTFRTNSNCFFGISINNGFRSIGLPWPLSFSTYFLFLKGSFNRKNRYFHFLLKQIFELGSSRRRREYGPPNLRVGSDEMFVSSLGKKQIFPPSFHLTSIPPVTTSGA